MPAESEEIASLPDRDWMALVEERPWEVIADALVYEYRGEVLPEALADAAMGAAMLVISTGLIKADEYDLDDLDALWERDDYTFEFTFDPHLEAISATAKFTDGAEPRAVSVTGSGLQGHLRAFFKAALSGRKGDDVAESEDFDPCGSFDCSLPKGHNMGRADIPANHHSEEIESLSWRCKDEGHEFLCRMAEGSCVRCIPQQAQSQQALTDQFAVGHQAVTRLGLYDLADWMRAAFFGSSEVTDGG